MKRLTQDQLDEAQRLFPDPLFTQWYLRKFPIRYYIGAGCLFVVWGFILTAMHRNASIPTFIVCVMLVIGAVLHLTAWYKKRIIERKRAKYLGISLQEYLSIN